MKLRIIICGGRHFDDYRTLEAVVNKKLEEDGILPTEVEIVSGHCQGADVLGERYAKEYGCSLRVYPADWTKYGRAAGAIRNKQMVDYIVPFENRLVIAFVNENTHGTKNTISQAKKLSIPVIEIPY